MATAGEATATASTTVISLTIRLSSGERFTVEVPSSNATIKDTKAKIEDITKSGSTDTDTLEASRQRLVYKGRILDDDARSLADYGIVSSPSTLFLVMSSSNKKKTNNNNSPQPAAAANNSPQPAAINANVNVNANANANANPWGAGGSAVAGAGAANPFLAGMMEAITIMEMLILIQ